MNVGFLLFGYDKECVISEMRLRGCKLREIEDVNSEYIKWKIDGIILIVNLLVFMMIIQVSEF